IARVGFDERSGKDRLSGDDLPEPALFLCIRSELGNRRGAEDERRKQRNRRDEAPGLLEQDRELGNTEAHAAEFFRQSDAEKARIGKRLPQLAVEPLARLLEVGQPFGLAEVAEELLGKAADVFLFARESEIHCRLLSAASAASRGRPSR